MSILYLSGCTNDRIEPALVEQGIGLMVQPGTGYTRRLATYPFHAADNGCFNPKTYVGDDRLLSWLDALPERERCLFAVVPDVARRPDGELGGDPEATWHRFEKLGPLVQELGFPAALAAQDGMERMGNVGEQIDACDCLFLGGSTEWKLGIQAELLARQARAKGKWVHMGRVNSLKRMERARAMGCNSVDGTFLGFGPDANIVHLTRWILALDMNRMLPGFDTFEMPEHPTHRAAVVSPTGMLP